MSAIKRYTIYKNTHFSHHRNHRLIKVAGERGLTGIEITFVPHDLPGRGWWLKSKEIERLFLGYQVGESEIRIGQIPTTIKPPKSNEKAFREKMHEKVISGLMCPITGETICQ